VIGSFAVVETIHFDQLDGGASTMTVRMLPAPKAGDDAVAYQLTPRNWPERSTTVTIVRSGTTFITYSMPQPTDHPTSVPREIADAQTKKLTAVTER
jgi:hypothetical protein